MLWLKTSVTKFTSKLLSGSLERKQGLPIETVSMHVVISKWRAINDRLLDIDINMDSVTGRDRIFYLDQ